MYILVVLALSLVRWFVEFLRGPLLGPICFSLFINDLPLAVKVDVVLLADDAAFVITCDTFHGLIDKIKELFSDLSNYLNMNQLVLTSSKSKLDVFKIAAHYLICQIFVLMEKLSNG